MSKINSATKRMLALLLAMILIFSGVAITSNASDENDESATVTTSQLETTETTTDATTTTPTTVPAPTVPAPTVTKDDNLKTITVKAPVVAGYVVRISFEPSTAYKKLNDGSFYYEGLTAGKTYTIKAYVEHNDEQIFSPAVTVTIKDKYPTPDAPVATKITSTSITALKVTGCEYKLVKADDQSIVKDWSDTVLFENLTAETKYVLSIRKKGDANKNASDPASITVKTLEEGKSKAVGKPVLVDKTDKTIIVACAKGDEKLSIEFSIDKGKTWQHSGEFKNLTPNTIYGIIARETYDPSIQDANPSSEILELRTNTKPRFEASLSKCTFKIAEGKIYADQLIGVTVTGDGPADLYLAEYGDTKLVPSQVLVGGRDFVIENGKGEIVPGKSNANSTAQAIVVYNKYKYIGGNEWELVGEVSTKYEFEVGPEKTFFVVIGEFFVSIANFFLDTVPSFILGTGDYWEKGLAFLFGMFEKIK